MLFQLQQQGVDVSILGATNFDAPKGISRLAEAWPQVEAARSKMGLVQVQDGELMHHLVATRSTARDDMTSLETSIWLARYLAMLAQIKPDLVFYYGGQPLDLLIAREARVRGIPVAFYLANASYNDTLWCRDVDLILTDSQSTTDFYKENHGYPVTPVGAFIDPAQVVGEWPSRQRILLVNPSLEKGVGIFIQLAMLMAERRPDIVFEVVESRGDWPRILSAVSRTIGRPVDTLPNVVVTPNTSDMRPVYARARLLMAPSLCRESAGRVAAEAMLNGIPAIVTKRGGLPEMVGDAAVFLEFPDEFYEPPYLNLPRLEIFEPLLARIERFYDDELHYQLYVARAREVARRRHSLEANTARLLKALAPLFAQRAGDLDHAALQRQAHRHGLGPR